MTTLRPWTAQNKPPVSTEVIVNPAYTAKYVGKRWTVHSHRVKNVLLAPLNQPVGAKRLIIPPEMLLPTFYPPVPEGSVVRVKGPRWKQSPEKLYVVLIDNTYKNNTVRITELGGAQNGSYWPKVPRGYLTVIPLDTLVAALPK